MDDYEKIERPMERLTPSSTTDSAQPGTTSVQVPRYTSSVLQSNRSDGYWVETFHFDLERDRVPGIIVSGLVSGLIEFLDNPIAEAEHKAREDLCDHDQLKDVKPTGEWTKYEIGKFDSPVAVTAVDITGNGLMDLVICHDYGPFMLECNPTGGHVTWLENPGRDRLKYGHWKERYIGRWPAMHRVKAGHFTQKSYLEVIAASVVYGPHDKTTPIPIIRFQAPEKVLEAAEWPRDIIDDENFTVIHEVTVRKFNGTDGLDSMLISSREGLTWLYYENHAWHRELITIGEPMDPRQSPTSESPGSGDHWGTGCSDSGKFGDDPLAYIATLDPFHGIAACVYTKVDRGMKQQKWKRHVLDVYGTPNQQLKTGDGPGHYIICADFDGDGNDEFLLSLFGPLDRDEHGEAIPPGPGPNPNKGIMYYKPLDLENGIFAKWLIAEESTARIAIGDFAGKGLVDLVSISYNVKRYYEEPGPVVRLYLNDFLKSNPTNAERAIIPTVWNKEGMVYVRDPANDKSLRRPHSMPLIDVGNYAISIEVYPKGHAIPVGTGHGIKVLYGSIGFFSEGKSYATLPAEAPVETRSPFSVAPFTASTTTTSYNTGYASNITGAILLRLVPTSNPSTFSTVGDVPVVTKLDTSSFGVNLDALHFNRVDSLWWGADNPFFKDVDFYNLTGFHIRLLDSKKPICHMQFWTAGSGVNCGVHNHSDALFSEIHISLSAGTNTGGMSRLKAELEDTPPKDMNTLDENAFDHLELKPLEEHGGMWKRDPYGKPVRGKNNVVQYPWHKWQAGKDPGVDVWLALEFNVDK